MAALVAVKKCRHHCLDSRTDAVDRKLLADDPCRRHKHLILRHTKKRTHLLRRLLTVAHAFLSGARVCNSRIDNDCLCLFALIYHMLIPLDRSSLYNILREGSRHITGNFTVDHRHILPVLILDSCRRTCRFKALCRGHTAFDLFHKFTPSIILRIVNRHIILIYNTFVIIDILAECPSESLPEAIPDLIFLKGDQVDFIDLLTL